MLIGLIINQVQVIYHRDVYVINDVIDWMIKRGKQRVGGSGFIVYGVGKLWFVLFLVLGSEQRLYEILVFFSWVTILCTVFTKYGNKCEFEMT